MLTVLMLMENNKIFYPEEHVQIHMNATVQTVKVETVLEFQLIKIAKAIKTVIKVCIVILKNIGLLKVLVLH